MEESYAELVRKSEKYKTDKTNHAENDVWNERTNFTTPPKRSSRQRNFSVEK